MPEKLFMAWNTNFKKAINTVWHPTDVWYNFKNQTVAKYNTEHWQFQVTFKVPNKLLLILSA